eukprot:GHVL01022590.1.p2 GENE.GHVL01022590.1~~GHVL01022590.1.p2  ORF type:complete len:406 (+),score=61.81 GHVL01022590.1:7142-8359(+)
MDIGLCSPGARPSHLIPPVMQFNKNSFSDCVHNIERLFISLMQTNIHSVETTPTQSLKTPVAEQSQSNANSTAATITNAPEEQAANTVYLTPDDWIRQLAQFTPESKKEAKCREKVQAEVEKVISLLNRMGLLIEKFKSSAVDERKRVKLESRLAKYSKKLKKLDEMCTQLALYEKELPLGLYEFVDGGGDPIDWVRLHRNQLLDEYTMHLGEKYELQAFYDKLVLEMSEKRRENTKDEEQPSDIKNEEQQKLNCDKIIVDSQKETGSVQAITDAVESISHTVEAITKSAQANPESAQVMSNIAQAISNSLNPISNNVQHIPDSIQIISNTTQAVPDCDLAVPNCMETEPDCAQTEPDCARTEPDCALNDLNCVGALPVINKKLEDRVKEEGLNVEETLVKMEIG